MSLPILAVSQSPQFETCTARRRAVLGIQSIVQRHDNRVYVQAHCSYQVERETAVRATLLPSPGS